MAAGRQDGFTLVEMLVALAISTAAIALAVAVSRIVTRATQSVRSAERDWVTEQFVREQFSEADQTLTETLSLARAETERFSFVTRRSALYGINGPPVLASYWYDDAAHSLQYREAALPAWWPADQARRQISYDQLSTSVETPVWQGTALSNVSGVNISYWNAEALTWERRNANHERLPKIVRIRLSRFGETRDIALGVSAVSSSSSSSGSSPVQP
jgi:prepilin-type N-terminal cleavage/methylation domain-containing protein